MKKMTQQGNRLFWGQSLALAWISWLPFYLGAEEIKVHCPARPEPVPIWERAKTYEGMPFQPGEEAKYELYYGPLNVFVGYGYLRVAPPERHEVSVQMKGKEIEKARVWHRVFQAEAFTGDWYKLIFAAHDRVVATVRPWDFGASYFFIHQDEQKPLSKRYQIEKWLNFDHVVCKSFEKISDGQVGKKENREIPFAPRSLDAMAALYHMRTVDFKKQKFARVPVYTSEKNWWLEVRVEGEEKVQTKLGSFNTVRLDVKSFLGKELQQKGRLTVWMATDTPEHMVLQVRGRVNFGDIYISLVEYTKGSR